MAEGNSNDGNSGSGDQDRRLSGSGDESGNGCTRWIIWASYVRSGSGSANEGESGNVNGNAEGDDRRNDRDMRYYSQYNTGSDDDSEQDDDFDCHTRNTNWQLLGVYRQDYYQFLEQITKHMWSYDSWEYGTMLNVLDYTSTYCKEVGYYENQLLYVDVMPKHGGNLEMGLYTDDTCITKFDGDVNYDMFLQSDYYGGYGEDDNDKDESVYGEYGNGYDYGNGNRRKLRNSNTDYKEIDGMEYTLTDFNAVFDTFRKCTSCVDYPTYQDGYLIGNTGTDDESLINQVSALGLLILLMHTFL